VTNKDENGRSLAIPVQLDGTRIDGIFEDCGLGRGWKTSPILHFFLSPLNIRTEVSHLHLHYLMSHTHIIIDTNVSILANSETGLSSLILITVDLTLSQILILRLSFFNG